MASITMTTAANRTRSLKHQSEYQGHIDGLRCLSVVLVCLYHFDLPPFSGGFVGVDVFFTISGFLIIGSVVAQVERGEFSPLGFWQRRIRRLAPAIIAVLLLCLAGGIALFTPRDLWALAQQSTWAILSVLNFSLVGTADYFDLQHLRDPLIHFWSLAVEEQFYLLIPLLAVGLMRWVPARLYRAVFLGLLAALSVASLLLAEWWIASARQDLAYYMMPSRFSQLALGGMLGIGLLYPAARDWVSRLPSSLHSGVTLLSAGLILFAATSLDGSVDYPGWRSLIPTLGALGILCCGGHGVTRWIWQNATVRYIGRASFALYLVHWPVWVFASYALGRAPSAEETALVAAGSLLIALVIHHGIENPVRFGIRFQGPRMYRAIGPSLLMLVVAVNVALVFEGLPARTGVSDPEMYADEARFHYLYFGGRSTPMIGLIGDERATPEVLFVGDSKMTQFAGALHAELADQGRSGFLVASHGCPFTLDAKRLQEGQLREDCYDAAIKALEVAAQRDVPIVMAKSWSSSTYRNQLVDLEGVPLEDTSVGTWVQRQGLFIRKLAQLSAGPILIVGDNRPIGDQPPLTCLLKPSWLGLDCDQLTSIDEADFQVPEDERRLVAMLGSEIAYLQPEALYCSAGRCRQLSAEGRVLYSDPDHLSIWGGKAFAPKLLAWLDAVQAHAKEDA